MMTTNPFLRFILSPLATLLTILTVEWTSHLYGFTATIALPVTALTLCLFWSGLRANILSALFVTVYAFHLFYLGDPARFIQLMLTVWPIAIGGGQLKRWLVESVREAEREHLRAEENQVKADAFDTLNGNIDTLRKLARRISDLTNGWELLNDDAKIAILEEVQGTMVNLAQKVVGWHEIAKEKRSLLED